jgi:chromate transporter
MLFLRLGCTAFGGPAAHVAVMEAEVVTRRGWVTRAEFLDQLGVVQLLPGPNSTELAIHLGHHRAGWRGGLAAGLCFVLPSVILVWLLAALTSGAAIRPVISSALWWLTPVVVAVLVTALWRFGRQAVERPHVQFVMPLTTVAAFVVAGDLSVLAIGAAASIVLAGISTKALARIAMLSLGALGAGALLAQTGPGTAEAPDALGVLVYFLRAGVSVFGSGYVLFSFLQHDLVDAQGWLSLSALTQASALAQITPGPLFTTATAVGFVLAGNAGALAATVGIFAPAFLSVAISAPVRALTQRSPVTRAALDGVVIASVALLGRAVVAFAWPLQAWQWIFCVFAVWLLFGTRVSSTVLLLAAALAGILAVVFHLPPFLST